MVDTFSKSPREPLSARAEAAGLRWLGEASNAVVRVVEVSDNTIVTQRVSPGRPSPEAARQAGEELARIHAAGAEAFGQPPAGWDGPNYIGTQPQDCTPTDKWAHFYVQQRVLPFARKAAQHGNLRDLDIVEKACAAITATNWDVTPARIHGDLWAGNLLFGEEGPAFIDPAAHGGHPHTDLAMLALFGAPYLEEIYRGYARVRPLPKGWEHTIPVHQLHPLAVHAYTHGPSYGMELERAARATLDLLS
ncbi:Fructosamine-3-kinase [Corynebacterium renale]|nr:Fructosamine-3-kinase [Corynebacterium renale]STC98667.1 Fructosamine-3-kinase [Corynebacterium renale]